MLRPAFTSISTKLSTIPELIEVLNKKLAPLFIAVGLLVDTANGFSPGRKVVAAYLLTLADGFVRADATAGAFAVTLPTAASAPGKRYTVKKVDAGANAVTVTAAGAELIDGAATKVLAAAWAVTTIQSNGVGWDVL